MSREGGCYAAPLRRSNATSARFAASRLATLKIIEVHVHLSASFDRRLRVAAEATADGVGDDPKALAELVDEAKGELPVNNGGSGQEDSGHFRGLVLFGQQGGAGEAAPGRLSSSGAMLRTCGQTSSGTANSIGTPMSLGLRPVTSPWPR